MFFHGWRGEIGLDFPTGGSNFHEVTPAAAAATKSNGPPPPSPARTLTPPLCCAHSSASCSLTHNFTPVVTARSGSRFGRWPGRPTSTRSYAAAQRKVHAPKELEGKKEGVFSKLSFQVFFSPALGNTTTSDASVQASKPDTFVERGPSVSVQSVSVGHRAASQARKKSSVGGASESRDRQAKPPLSVKKILVATERTTFSLSNKFVGKFGGGT